MRTFPRDWRLLVMIFYGVCLVIVALIFLYIAFVVLLLNLGGAGLIPHEIKDIFESDLGDGYSIRIWSERDWDPDHAYPAIYYEISHNNAIVVPTHYVTNEDDDFNYDIHIAYADGGNLVAVYDTVLWEDCVYIFFDKRNAEGSGHCPSQDWAKEYFQLKEANPDLPLEFYWLEELPLNIEWLEDCESCKDR